MMSVMEKVRTQVQKAEPGKVITYNDFSIGAGETGALAAALSRLSRAGEITRLAKGKYYKPKKTAFGVLKPQEGEIINSLIRNGSELVAYESGLDSFRKLGVTTQITNEVVLVSKRPRQATQYGKLRVRFVKSPASEFVQQDIPLLRLLDVLKYIKNIPDSNIDTTLDIISSKLKQLSKEEVKRIITLGLLYNPSTKALLGALLEQLNYQEEAEQLRNSLNKLTSYKLNISNSYLPNKRSWNII